VPSDDKGAPGLQKAALVASPGGEFLLLYGGRNLGESERTHLRFATQSPLRMPCLRCCQHVQWCMHPHAYEKLHGLCDVGARPRLLRAALRPALPPTANVAQRGLWLFDVATRVWSRLRVDMPLPADAPVSSTAASMHLAGNDSAVAFTPTPDGGWEIMLAATGPWKPTNASKEAAWKVRGGSGSQCGPLRVMWGTKGCLASEADGGRGNLPGPWPATRPHTRLTRACAPHATRFPAFARTARRLLASSPSFLPWRCQPFPPPPPRAALGYGGAQPHRRRRAELAARRRPAGQRLRGRGQPQLQRHAQRLVAGRRQRLAAALHAHRALRDAHQQPHRAAAAGQHVRARRCSRPRRSFLPAQRQRRFLPSCLASLGFRTKASIR
jgi:hypothetical protein